MKSFQGCESIGDALCGRLWAVGSPGRVARENFTPGSRMAVQKTWQLTPGIPAVNWHPF